METDAVARTAVLAATAIPAITAGRIKIYIEGIRARSQVRPGRPVTTPLPDIARRVVESPVVRQTRSDIGRIVVAVAAVHDIVAIERVTPKVSRRCTRAFRNLKHDFRWKIESKPVSGKIAEPLKERADSG